MKPQQAFRDVGNVNGAPRSFRDVLHARAIRFDRAQLAAFLDSVRVEARAPW
jgi:hypothetical protein